MELNGPFERLLRAFDGVDRERAGQKYEAARRKLHMFFAARNCGPAEELADETFERAARRLDEGIVLDAAVETFLLGVARNVAREHWKKAAAGRTVPFADVFATAPAIEASAGEAACLDRCLAKLGPNSRSWVIRFYAFGAGSEKIRGRAVMARELGLDSNALRVRMHRIRVTLAACVRECLDGHGTR